VNSEEADVGVKSTS